MGIFFRASKFFFMCFYFPQNNTRLPTKKGLCSQEFSAFLSGVGIFSATKALWQIHGFIRLIMDLVWPMIGVIHGLGLLFDGAEALMGSFHHKQNSSLSERIRFSVSEKGHVFLFPYSISTFLFWFLLNTLF